jgi:hypothetical protein
MGWFVSFAVGDSDDPVDGDEVASNSGWGAFSEWAAGLPDDYPELGYLGEYGEIFPADALGRLEADLVRALREKPGDPPRSVLHVAQQLLAAVKARPEGAEAMVVTDGTEGGDEEDE